MLRSTVNAAGDLLVVAGFVVLEGFAMPDFGSSPGLVFTIGLVLALLLVLFGLLTLMRRPYGPGILSVLAGSLMIVLSMGYLRWGITASPYFVPGVLILAGGVVLLSSNEPDAVGLQAPRVGGVTRRSLLFIGFAMILGSFAFAAAFEWEYWFIPDCFLYQGSACGLPILLAEAGLAFAVAAVLVFAWMAWVDVRRVSRPPAQQATT